jgi:copper(I)-binding protein
MVKYNGEYYSAGTEVPVEAETNKGTEVPVEAETNKGTEVPVEAETKSKTSKSKVEKQ